MYRRWTPGQTLATLGPRSPLYWHLMVEAKKLAYADLYQYNADPNFSAVPVDRLLSAEYAASQCARVDPERASHADPHRREASGKGDTIVLATADTRGQHGVVGEQQLQEFRVRHHGARIRIYFCMIAGHLFTLDPGSTLIQLRRTSVRTTRCRRDS